MNGQREMCICTNNKTGKRETKTNVAANLLRVNATYYLRSHADFEVRFVNTLMPNALFCL